MKERAQDIDLMLNSIKENRAQIKNDHLFRSQLEDFRKNWLSEWNKIISETDILSKDFISQIPPKMISEYTELMSRYKLNTNSVFLIPLFVSGLHEFLKAKKIESAKLELTLFKQENNIDYISVALSQPNKSAREIRFSNNQSKFTFGEKSITKAEVERMVLSGYRIIDVLSIEPFKANTFDIPKSPIKGKDYQFDVINQAIIWKNDGMILPKGYPYQARVIGKPENPIAEETIFYTREQLYDCIGEISTKFNSQTNNRTWENVIDNISVLNKILNTETILQHESPSVSVSISFLDSLDKRLNEIRNDVKKLREAEDNILKSVNSLCRINKTRKSEWRYNLTLYWKSLRENSNTYDEVAQIYYYEYPYIFKCSNRRCGEVYHELSNEECVVNLQYPALGKRNQIPKRCPECGRKFERKLNDKVDESDIRKSILQLEYKFHPIW